MSYSADFFSMRATRPADPIDWSSLDAQATPADRTPTASQRSASWRRACYVVALLISLLPMAGCGGCRSDIVPDSEEAKKRLDEEELEKKKEEEKKKPDFELGVLQTLPNPLLTVESANKPGHWTSAQLEVTANNFDFNGQLVTDPFPLPGTAFSMGTSRPAVLPKGQKKFLELTYFVPPGQHSVFATTRLRQSERGGDVMSSSYPMMRMPTHQFYLLVLSGESDRFGFIKSLDSVEPPGGDVITDARQLAHYRVLAPPIDNRVPLPSYALTWTAIAYIFWDDVGPSVLSSDQQQALLDWLHWGGQLVISGPDSLDALAGSFLEPYLPATSAGSVDLAAADFAAINDHWCVDVPAIEPEKDWTGVKLKLADGGVPLAGTGDMIVERRVGRGRIVVTRFSIGQRGLITWPGYDNLFNACLLRRPARKFSQSSIAGVAVNDGNDDYVGDISCQWAGLNRYRNDPRLISQLRYFSRDEGTSYAYLNELSSLERQMRSPDYAPWQTNQMNNVNDEPRIEAGVAGWSDFNATASSARSALQQASGIDVPDTSFVLRMLVGYLIILVPVNYAIFRGIGRVEWAWIAVPVIALGCSALIVQLAQLDIGFARAETEVGIVEVQPGYERAHVTRYVSLYTSISTEYDFDFEDPGALVQPFSTTGTDPLLVGQSPTIVNYRRDRGVTLSGYQVASNSLGMVHSEHMTDLGGAISLRRQGDRTMLVNDSLLTIKDAGIISPDGVARLGTVEPGASVAFVLEPRRDDSSSLWSDTLTVGESAAGERGTLDIGAMLRDADRRCPEGETRLLGWSDEKLPGMAMVPAASQQRQANLIVVHLDHESLGDAQPDVNAPPRKKDDYNTVDGKIFEQE
ncbi:MAG: hypothetical protein KDA63_00015 [Planctomycetales bacterium]|nr:hypothetical protein [Planctomycetales bacterium]